MQRFAQQQHISFASAIGCITGRCFIAKAAGDEKNMPRSSLYHIGRKEVREFGNRQHVESRHGEDLLNWLANKISEQPKASVIHQNVHYNALLIESSFQLG